MKMMKTALRCSLLLLALTCCAHAQTRTMLKNSADNTLLESFSTGAKTITIAPTGTLVISSGATITGGQYITGLSASNVSSGSLALARIAQGGATSGQALAWNGTDWAPTTISSGVTIDTTPVTGGTDGNLLAIVSGKVGQVSTSANMQTFLTSANYTAMRAALGLTINTNVQAYDGDLVTWSSMSPSSTIQAFVNGGTVEAMRGVMGVTPGTDVQAYNANTTLLGSSIDLTSEITGVLPVANGGTGLSSLGAGVASWLGTPSKSNLDSAISATLATTGSVNQFVSGQRVGSATGDYIALGSGATRELRIGSDAFALGSANWLVGLYDSGSLVASGGLNVYWESSFAVRKDLLIYGQFAWSDGTTFIKPVADHLILADRFSPGAPCRWSVANTYTDTTHYECGVIDWQTTANTLRVGSDVGSAGGTARDVALIHGGTEKARIAAAGFIIGSTGTPSSKLKHGVATLAAGTVTVSDSDVVETGTPATTSRILITRMTDGGTIGDSFSITRTNATSFTITAKTAGVTASADTSVVSWLLINP